MKITFFGLFFMFCMSICYAQVTDTSKSLKINPVDSLKKVPLDLKIKPAPIKGLTNKNVSPKLISESPKYFSSKSHTVDMTNNSRLPSPEWKINQTFGEDYKDLNKFARDYYLGDIKTTSKTVIIKCRDHEYVDGDRIKLMLNNVVIHPNIRLRGDFYTIDIDLKEGLNSIDFIALNEGESSPNTAQLIVLDPDENLLATNRWLLRTGFKASLIIIKE